MTLNTDRIHAKAEGETDNTDSTALAPKPRKKTPTGELAISSELAADRSIVSHKQGKSLAKAEMQAFATGYAETKAKLTTQFFTQLEEVDPIAQLLNADIEFEDDDDDDDFFGDSLGQLNKGA